MFKQQIESFFYSLARNNIQKNKIYYEVTT